MARTCHRIPGIRAALNRTGGPTGFTLGGQTLWRRGEIRQWIADVEASQQPEADDHVEEPAA